MRVIYSLQEKKLMYIQHDSFSPLTLGGYEPGFCQLTRKGEKVYRMLEERLSTRRVRETASKKSARGNPRQIPKPLVSRDIDDRPQRKKKAKKKTAKKSARSNPSRLANGLLR